MSFFASPVGLARCLIKFSSIRKPPYLPRVSKTRVTLFSFRVSRHVLPLVPCFVSFSPLARCQLGFPLLRCRVFFHRVSEFRTIAGLETGPPSGARGRVCAFLRVPWPLLFFFFWKDFWRTKLFSQRERRQRKKWKYLKFTFWNFHIDSRVPFGLHGLLLQTISRERWNLCHMTHGVILVLFPVSDFSSILVSPSRSFFV
jgi:hypothetical protein